MFKLAGILAIVVFTAASTAAFADSDKGKGDGKGRSGPAAAVSTGSKGFPANAASGFNGGWGQNGDVANSNARTFHT